MPFRLYIDEDVPNGLAKQLQNRGIDVLTTQNASNIGQSDRAQLAFATDQDRVF